MTALSNGGLCATQQAQNNSSLYETVVKLYWLLCRRLETLFFSKIWKNLWKLTELRSLRCFCNVKFLPSKQNNILLRRISYFNTCFNFPRLVEFYLFWSYSLRQNDSSWAYNHLHLIFAMLRSRFRRFNPKIPGRTFFVRARNSTSINRRSVYRHKYRLPLLNLP